MCASPRRLPFLAATLLLSTLAVPPALGQTQQGEAGRSEVVRIRLDAPDTKIFQVFLDRKPVELLYRRDKEVGLELVSDEDGIACEHDVAVVTTDGRLADLPGVNLCNANWVVTIDADRLSGGSAGSAAAPSDDSGGSQPDEAARGEQDAGAGTGQPTEEGEAAGDDQQAAGGGECGWLAIMACRRDKAAAEQESVRIMGGVSVISTDDYEGLNPGLFCAAQGPYSTQQEAEQNAGFFRKKGAPDAYTKEACEAGGGAGQQAADIDSGEGGQQGGDGGQQAGAPSGRVFGWEFTAPTGSGGPAVLAYGEPESGDLLVVGTCSPNSGRIALTVYDAPGNAAAGSQIDVSFSTEAFRNSYRATVGQKDPTTGEPTVSMEVDTRDELLEAIAGHRRLAVRMGNQRALPVSLRGSAGPARQFAATCAGGGFGRDEQAGRDDQDGRDGDDQAERDDQDRDDNLAGGGRQDQSGGDEGGAGPSGAVPSAARYSCRGGPDLEVFFPRGGARAAVSVDGDEPILLNRTAPGTYGGRGVELTAGGREATWSDGGGAPYRCTSR